MNEAAIFWLTYLVGFGGSIPFVSNMAYRHSMRIYNIKKAQSPYYSPSHPSPVEHIMAGMAMSLLWPLAWIGLGTLHLVTKEERDAQAAEERRKEIEKARAYLKEIEDEEKARFNRLIADDKKGRRS